MKDEVDDPQAVLRAALIELTLDWHVLAVRLRDVDVKVSDDFLRELRRLRREIRAAPGSELNALADELNDLLRAVAVEVIVILETSIYQRVLWLCRRNTINEDWSSCSNTSCVRWAEAA